MYNTIYVYRLYTFIYIKLMLHLHVTSVSRLCKFCLLRLKRIVFQKDSFGYYFLKQLIHLFFKFMSTNITHFYRQSTSSVAKVTQQDVHDI